MQYKIEYMPIEKLQVNPENPRLIKDKAFKSLVKSLKDCPSLFDARPCLCSDRTGELIILGGNMRFLAAKELKYKEVPVIVMSGLSEIQEREILLKDNGTTWGEWDMDLLSSWSDLPLVDWGVDLPEHWLETSELTVDDVAEDNLKLKKFIEAREKSRERGKDKNELNFWVCLVFQSYDQKHEFLRQLPEDIGVKYGMYVDGEAFAEAVGKAITPNTQKPYESKVEKTLKDRVL